MNPIAQCDRAERIVSAVCRHYPVTISDLCGHSRKWSLVWPRWIVMVLLSRLYDDKTVGHLLGHSRWTIAHARKGLRNQIETSPRHADEFRQIETKI